MKYFLVFILSCLSLAHDVKPMSTDPPSDVTSTTKHTTTAVDLGAEKPSSGSLRSSKLSKIGFNVSKTASMFMATIRESPSELYLCSATFIRNDTLLTTARCLLGRDTNKLFVHSNSSNLETEGVGNLAIKNVYIHPDFDMNPVTMDFGLITLQKPADSITPASLPSKKIGRPGTVGTMYTWRFTTNSSKFLIHEQQGEIISNSKCFVIEREIIPEDMVCAEGLPFQEGYFDHGMPFIITKKGKNYIFGISHISNKLVTKKVNKIWKIDAIMPWITDLLKEDNPKKRELTTQKTTVSTPANDDDDDDDDDDEEEDEEEEEDTM